MEARIHVFAASFACVVMRNRRYRKEKEEMRFNDKELRISAPWVTVVESLVQVTVVAGPPVEIQVRVSWLGSNVTPPDIETSPEQSAAESPLAQSHINFMVLASIVYSWLVSSIKSKLLFSYLHWQYTVPHRLCLSLRCQYHHGQHQLEYHSDRYQQLVS